MADKVRHIRTDNKPATLDDNALYFVNNGEIWTKFPDGTEVRYAGKRIIEFGGAGYFQVDKYLTTSYDNGPMSDGLASIAAANHLEFINHYYNVGKKVVFGNSKIRKITYSHRVGGNAPLTLVIGRKLTENNNHNIIESEVLFTYDIPTNGEFKTIINVDNSPELNADDQIIWGILQTGGGTVKGLEILTTIEIW